MRSRHTEYSLLLVCVIPLVFQISYAQSATVQEIPSLIIKIKNLKEDLDELQSKLEKIQQTNGTNNECGCENIQEQIDEIKSQLEKMEDLVDTDTECDCEDMTGPGPQPKYDPAQMAIISAISSVGVAIAYGVIKASNHKKQPQ